jgi:FlaA1/EpsC-like NDP-sugar epimerase
MGTRARDSAQELLRGKRVLITGAAGSIGAALTARLLDYDLEAVRALDINEERSFFLGLKHAGDRRLRILLGDICDRERMKRALHGVDIVFHLAALKHVGLGEYNPSELVRVNLSGLQTLIECAADAGAAKFVFTSSDKAVNPTNVMGGSKFLGERLVTAGNILRGAGRTVFTSTRFGNVLGSAGSVVEVFRRQIAAGGPVTLTDGRMTRFFMTRDEAVDLLLDALVLAVGGEVFVPKMHAVRMGDLTASLLELLARGRSMSVREVGARAGEKHYEELVSEHELPRCLETDGLFIVLPGLEERAFSVAGRNSSELGPGDYPVAARWASAAHSSQAVALLEGPALMQLLRAAALEAI